MPICSLQKRTLGAGIHLVRESAIISLVGMKLVQEANLEWSWKVWDWLVMLPCTWQGEGTSVHQILHIHRLWISVCLGCRTFILYNHSDSPQKCISPYVAEEGITCPSEHRHMQDIHTRRWETSGLRLNHASCGVMLLRDDVGRQFQTWIWAASASPHNEGGNYAS